MTPRHRTGALGVGNSQQRLLLSRRSAAQWQGITAPCLFSAEVLGVNVLQNSPYFDRVLFAEFVSRFVHGESKFSMVIINLGASEHVEVIAERFVVRRVYCHQFPKAISDRLLKSLMHLSLRAF